MSAEPTPASRSFARVEVRLPVRVRLLGDDEAEELARRYSAEPTCRERTTAESLLRAGDDATWDRQAVAAIFSRIEQLERTLARIAAAVGAEHDEESDWIAGESVKVSGAGLGLRIPRRIAEGAPVEVELTLLGDPTTVLRGVGRVASLVSADGDAIPVGRFHLGIALVAMHDEDREALIKHTFRVQRAQLRERRDAGS